ncbi:MAG: DHA2 family efflux MFS transporter permease subunit, partial [Gammaproteobacteria bacterium]
MSAAVVADAPPATRPNWPVVFAVMLIALLEVLDVTVVNVSLPHMIGAFGATPDQITWVVTSYMISTAIVMPLTGFLTGRFGRRPVLLVSIIGFLVTSVMCGAAWSLVAMVVFRLLQGAFGAVLIPLSQTVLLDAFPREKRALAMAIWSVAIMLAPLIGPVLGGYITEHYVWRWVFYVNLPLGLIGLAFVWGEVRDTPHRHQLSTDWFGLLLLSLALGSLQAVLDMGQHRDWFASRLIQVLTAVCVLSGGAFVWRGLTVANNIIDLRLFRDRNFTLGCILIATYCMSMFGTIILLPLLSQRLLGYPADIAGLIFLPRGAVSAICMILIGAWFAHRLDPRKLMLVGLCFTTVACLQMAQYTLETDMWGLTWPGIVQGIGMACIFGQISVVTFDRIPRERADEAAGIYSVMRTLGGAFGVALSGTLFVRQEQVHWNVLGG